MSSLKEIVLKVRAPPTWSSDAGLSPNNVRILECRTAPADKSCLSQLVEISSPHERLDQILERIKLNPEVIDASFSKTKRVGAIGMILSRHAMACRSVQKSDLFCRTCLFHSIPDDKGMMEWTLVIPDGHALDQFVGELESEEIEVEIKRVSMIINGVSLTPRQQSIVHFALDRGYFNYPRTTDLSCLARELKISKSNLSEILRRASKKALSSLLRYEASSATSR